MTDNDPDILVQRFLDGELPAEDLEPALHRIADDPEARALLQFELRMTQDLAATRTEAPPEDFAERTMGAVSRAAGPADDFGARLRAWWAALTNPATLQVRPVSAVVSVLLAAVVAWAVWPAAPTPEPGRTAHSTAAAPSQASTVQQTATRVSANGSTVWVRFLYPNSEADSVAVAGDFSQWDPVPLSPRTVGGKTVWTGLVPVPRGEHEYQFLINGDRWVTDPLAPVTRSDGFGAENAVLNV